MNEERDQTLNQLLTELDGFEGREGVLLLAATNRAEVLFCACWICLSCKLDATLISLMDDCFDSQSICTCTVLSSLRGTF